MMPDPHAVPALQYSVLRRRRWGAVPALALALLAGCSSLPPPPAPPPAGQLCAPRWRENTAQMQRWEFRGRITARSSQGRGSARIYWRQDREGVYTVRVQTLFGIRLALLTVDKRGAVLRVRGQQDMYAPHGEALALELLGLRVPVSAFSHWVRALSPPKEVLSLLHETPPPEWRDLPLDAAAAPPDWGLPSLDWVLQSLDWELPLFDDVQQPEEEASGHPSGCPQRLVWENWRVEYADYRAAESTKRPPHERHPMPHSILLSDDTHQLQLDIVAWRL